MSLIGLDIGTTSCKAIAFDESGRILASNLKEYAIDSPNIGWAEQDADDIWIKAIDVLAKTIKSSKDSPPTAMALSVQGEAIIPVNESFNPIAPAILGMDTRCVEENIWLDKNIGKDKLFDITGMPLHTINTLPKLLWIKNNRKNIWNKAYKFCLYEDYFVARLTGIPMISHCLASRTQMYDIHNGEWSNQILEKCKIESNLFSNLQPENETIVGYVTQEIQNLLNLSKPLLVVSGGHDQACAALGCGVTEAGQAMVSTGTAEVVEVVMNSPKLNPKLRDGGISVYRHVLPDRYLAMTLNHSGGILLKWFRDEFCQLELERSKNSNEDPYSLILKSAPDTPTTLLVLPHFSGSGTPFLDTNSKGAILGLTLSDTKGTIAKAILEGLTFELKINLDLLNNSNIEINELIAVGGGSKSSLWLSIKADILKIPINVPIITESACLGAAILAGVGVGIYSCYEDAKAQMISIDKRIIPQVRNTNLYSKKYCSYVKLYPLLTGI